MRIISGEFRRRRLADIGEGDAKAHLRPTSDRVREAIFSHLESGAYGMPIQGAHILDLFAGTGAMGLEALSRGAAHINFVDNGQRAGQIIEKNIRLLGVEARTKLHRLDATAPIALYPPPTPVSLVFLDPPYAKEMGEDALNVFLKNGWIASHALIVWEEGVPLVPPHGLAVLFQRRYAQSWISVLRAEKS